MFAKIMRKIVNEHKNVLELKVPNMLVSRNHSINTILIVSIRV